MKPPKIKTHNDSVLEKMRQMSGAPATAGKGNSTAMPELKAAAKSDSPTSLRSIQQKNARTNYDMQRSGVDDLYARMGKSIECGEYDAARLTGATLQSALVSLNNAANRLADLG